MIAAVIGAGPAGLMAAEVLRNGGADVTVYDRMPSAGRKFLMAGRGGLNLTHSEEFEPFMTRYGTAAEPLRAAIAAFPPEALRAWCEALGQPTFVGSSGRVFPRSMKSSPLLRAWLRRLDAAGVRFAFRHAGPAGMTKTRSRSDTPGGPLAVNADATVLALGGASWPRLGSDGGWTDILANAGVSVSPLKPSNSGFLANWSDHFKKHAGQPLKRIALCSTARPCAAKRSSRKAASRAARSMRCRPLLRRAIETRGEVAAAHRAASGHERRRDRAPPGAAARQAIAIDLPAQGAQPFARRDRPAAGGDSGALATLAPADLARLVNDVPIRLTGIAPIARAISTAGGIPFGEIDERFMLRRRPACSSAGEMLDWEAPTGGYLLQACFATGAAAGAARWSGPHDPGRRACAALLSQDRDGRARARADRAVLIVWRFFSFFTFSSFCRQRTIFGIGLSGKLVFQLVTPTSPR